MSEITVNHKLTLKIHGGEEIVYCTTMGNRMKIKAVHFKCSSKVMERHLKQAISNYNKLSLSITIQGELFWFDVIKLGRNIPLPELS